MTAATKVKLYYFDIKGKGEPIRLACTYAKIPLEDVRVKRGTNMSTNRCTD